LILFYFILFDSIQFFSSTYWETGDLWTLGGFTFFPLTFLSLLFLRLRLLLLHLPPLPPLAPLAPVADCFFFLFFFSFGFLPLMDISPPCVF